MQVPAAAVAAEVIKQGGSKEQAWVAAALVSGVESDGDPTELSGGIGPAAGLFQFEPGTWIGNGGGAFAPVAQDATWQQQVTVFLHASAGNNFHAWGPDLVANSGDPNSASNPSYSYSGPPQPGSRVSNAIAQIAPSVGAILGNVPSNWADAGAAGPGIGNQALGTAGSVAQEAAQSGLLGLSGLVATSNPLSWADALGRILTEVVSADWWKRVGIFTLGIVLVGGGIILFVSTTQTGQKIESDAATAAVVAA